MCDMVGQFIQKKEEEKQIKEDQEANARYWKILSSCYDDDDDDYTFAITPNELDNSLSMGDEHLDTIPKTESDEFIKSSIENLVPNPSESEGEHECDVPACEVFTTFLNILFDADYDFYSNQHHFNDESNLIESLLNHDSSIISSSSKIDSLFDEFAGKLTILKLIPPGIDKTDCDPEEETRFIQRLLYDNSSPHPPEEFIYENSDAAIESFSLSYIPVEDSDSLMEEIDLSFTPDYPMPPGIREDDYDSERNILILEELLSNNSLSLPENESFHFDIPSFSRPPAKPPNGNTRILNVKVMGDISEHKYSWNLKTNTEGFCPSVFISSASFRESSTAHIQPPAVPISIQEPDVPRTQPKPTIPYSSRLNDQKLREKATNQIEKFFQIFHDFHFDISSADALLLMLKFASTIKSLLTNKDKLFELAKVSLNENCSAMILKKLPEKLGDLGKFLIPCNFPGMDVCHALPDLRASINLMPLSIS
nr:reverse transcriptase domain-containing protein [Tanacetum cinerariifolium]